MRFIYLFFCEWEKERARKLNKMSVVVQQWLCRLHATLTSTIHAPILCLHLSESWPSLLCISCHTHSSNAVNYRVSFTTGGFCKIVCTCVCITGAEDCEAADVRLSWKTRECSTSGEKRKRNLLILIKKWSIAREKMTVKYIRYISLQPLHFKAM